SGRRRISVIVCAVRKSEAFAPNGSAPTHVQYHTSVVAGSFVVHRTVAVVEPIDVTVTSCIVGPLARIFASAVAVCGGETSWYVAVTISRSRTWSTLSGVAVPNAVAIEPCHVSPGPPRLIVTFSPAGSVLDATCTTTEVASESPTET